MDGRRIHRIWRYRDRGAIRLVEDRGERQIIRKDASGRERDVMGRVLARNGLPIRWGYCIACSQPLRAYHSQVDGFGNSCYVRLDRGERRRLYDRAVELREIERRDYRYHRLRLIDRWRLWRGVIKQH